MLKQSIGLRGWRRSLAVQVAAGVFLTETVVVASGFGVIYLLGVWHDPVNIEVVRAQPFLIRALHVTPQGRLSIEGDSGLDRMRSANPTLRTAVVDPTTGETAIGSSPELTTLFKVLADKKLSPLNFTVDLTELNGRQVILAMYASDWRWSNLPAALVIAMMRNVAVLACISLLVCAVTTVVIWRGFRPLRRAAVLLTDNAAANNALPETLVPAEVQPFVRAVNDSFALVAEKISREKRFLANAAHELRTPIAVMRARIDRMELREASLALARDTDAIARVVAQLLTLSRLENTVFIADDRIDMLQRVRMIVADLAPLAIADGRDIDVTAFDAPIIAGNAIAFDSAVRNVIENALRAEPLHGTVNVRVGPGMAVIVEDHGAGIPPNLRETVFDPFWRGDTASTGAGLGLAIARDAVRAHGGDIRITSTPGGGAIFCLEFRNQVITFGYNSA